MISMQHTKNLSPAMGKWTRFVFALEGTLAAQNFPVPAQKHFF